MNAAPIALFVYNRPQHTRLTVEALLKNELAGDSDLHVFCDGARNAEASAACDEVREYVRTVTGFRSTVIVERESNQGLAASIIAGVTSTCGDHGRVIVVEDDLQTSPYFLRYMNDALDMYADDADVGSIHGYWYPIASTAPETFFLRGASCWGWATWSRGWRQFEADGQRLLAELKRRNLTRAFDLDGAIDYTRMLEDQIAGRIDSWAIRWHASMFLANRLQLSPGISLVRNLGFDGTGTHCIETDKYGTEVAGRPIAVRRIPLAESVEARALLASYHRRSRISLAARVAGRLRRALGR